MKKYHIPFDLISQDGENDLHEKVNKDSKFSRYYQEFAGLLDETIEDKKIKDRISDACRLVYVFSEIAAYREGFQEGIRFLMNVTENTCEPEKICKRDRDFNDALEIFLTEYRLDRIADVHNFLEKNEKYKKVHDSKAEQESALQAAIQDQKSTDLLLDYITYVDFLIDEVKTIFYEHGFKDSSAITSIIQRA